MALFDATRPFTSAAAQGGVTRLLSSVVGAIAAWNDARVTHKALSKLSAHELEDIGLHRGDIDRMTHRGERW